jgi:hypothetical protein
MSAQNDHLLSKGIEIIKLSTLLHLSIQNNHLHAENM